MPSSDSEDFESADEGHFKQEKKCERKKRTSSNYSDSTNEHEPDKTHQASDKTEIDVVKTLDGWENFDLEEKVDSKENPKEKTYLETKNVTSQPITTQQPTDTSWDDFADWGQDDINNKSQVSSNTDISKKDVKFATDESKVSSDKGWSWGWGVDSFLNSATASISTITNQVTQGLSTVIETSIGAPDPTELARQTAKKNESNTQDKGNTEKTGMADDKPVTDAASAEDVSDVAFPFGSILSGVTKFVETTGTKVISGGLDTLETIGKKTMEVLQDGDPGLAKKRALFGLDSGEKPVLSQLLREAKTKADEEDRVREEKREAKEVHYESLFDDYEGLVHLEALEMLSRQISMRIEERIRALDAQKRQDAKETLQQVAELCEMPEDEEDEQDPEESSSSVEVLQEKLQAATRDVGLNMHFQPLIKQYSEALDWLTSDGCQLSDKAVYKRAISTLAHTTALAVEVYHKTSELLLVKTRRSTADESDALTQLTVVLTKHVGELATLFTEKLNKLPSENKELTNTYITNIFLEAGNSSTYIQNAFQLTIPILQIGAV